MSLGKAVIMQQFMDEDMSKFAIEYAHEQMQNLFHEKVTYRYSSYTDGIGYCNVLEKSLRNKIQKQLALHRW